MEGFPNGFEVSWRGRDEVFRCEHGDFAARSLLPGVFFYFDPAGRLRRHDLSSGQDVVLYEGLAVDERLHASVSPDGRRLVVMDWKNDRATYFDAASGTVLYDVWGEGWRHEEWTGLEHPWAMLRSFQLELKKYSVRFVGGEGSWDIGFDEYTRIRCLEDGRLLRTGYDGGCELLDSRGRSIQTVFPLSDDVKLRHAGSAANP